MGGVERVGGVEGVGGVVGSDVQQDAPCCLGLLHLVALIAGDAPPCMCVLYDPFVSSARTPLLGAPLRGCCVIPLHPPLHTLRNPPPPQVLGGARLIRDGIFIGYIYAFVTLLGGMLLGLTIYGWTVWAY